MGPVGGSGKTIAGFPGADVTVGTPGSAVIADPSQGPALAGRRHLLQNPGGLLGGLISAITAPGRSAATLPYSLTGISNNLPGEQLVNPSFGGLPYSSSTPYGSGYSAFPPATPTSLYNTPVSGCPYELCGGSSGVITSINGVPYDPNDPTMNGQFSPSGYSNIGPWNGGGNISPYQVPVTPGSQLSGGNGIFLGGSISPSPSRSTAGSPGYVDPATGQFVNLPDDPLGMGNPNVDGSGLTPAATPAGNGTTPFFWSGGYWGYCPSPPAPAPGGGTRPPTPGAGGTQAVITSPTGTVPSGPGPRTTVALDARDSVAAPSRSIVAYGWVIRSQPDNNAVATATGPVAQVQLPIGAYTATLAVLDSANANSTTVSNFNVGSPGSTQAVITLPPSFVVAAPTGNTTVALDATGSTAAPGRSIASYNWYVTTQTTPRLPIANYTGSTATQSVRVPTGSYIVTLVVLDTSGLNATMTKNFVVGSGNANGTIAVITFPNSFQASNPNGPRSTIVLDAQGSTPALGSTITQYLWAIITLPQKTSAANATGRVTSVSLPNGNYQVGLLVIDSNNGNAIAKKNFTVGASALPRPTPGTPGTGGGGGGGASPPVIPVGLAFTGPTSSSVQITGVTSPEGNPVTLTWKLQPSSGTNTIKTGTGATVSLVGVQPGSYNLQLTANDGRGGVSTGVARLTVTPAGGPGPGPAPKASTSNLRLPSLSLSQNSIMEIDSASAGIPLSKRNQYVYKWALVRKTTRQPVSVLFGPVGRFDLTSADSYELQLNATDNSSNMIQRAVSTVRVLAKSASTPEDVTVRGSCGPFSVSSASQEVKVSCPKLTVSGPSQLTYAWRLTRPSDGTAVKTAAGKQASFGVVTAGTYIVELAVGAGSKAPTSASTVYFLSSVLQVGAETKSPSGSAATPAISVPQSVCAGATVTLVAPQTAGQNPSYNWQIKWEDAKAITGGNGVTTGSERTIKFKLQPGKQSVTLTVRAAGRDPVTIKATVVGEPCIKCITRPITLNTTSGTCAPSTSVIRSLLSAPAPTGVMLFYPKEQVLTPGTRSVKVTAMTPTSQIRYSCTVPSVTIQDKIAPAVSQRSTSGRCLSPANGKWHCFKAEDLFKITDNCSSAKKPVVTLSCQGSSSSDCVIAKGQACLKASTASGGKDKVVRVRAVVKDGYGNTAKPVETTVRSTAKGNSCNVAGLSKPPV